MFNTSEFTLSKALNSKSLLSYTDDEILLATFTDKEFDDIVVENLCQIANTAIDLAYDYNIDVIYNIASYFDYDITNIKDRSVIYAIVNFFITKTYYNDSELSLSKEYKKYMKDLTLMTVLNRPLKDIQLHISQFVCKIMGSDRHIHKIAYDLTSVLLKTEATKDYIKNPTVEPIIRTVIKVSKTILEQEKVDMSKRIAGCVENINMDWIELEKNNLLTIETIVRRLAAITLNKLL